VVGPAAGARSYATLLQLAELGPTRDRADRGVSLLDVVDASGRLGFGECDCFDATNLCLNL
jgi:hypothetical protein